MKGAACTVSLLVLLHSLVLEWQLEFGCLQARAAVVWRRLQPQPDATRFSDDLTDFDYDHRGWFLNMVGKY